MSPQRTKQYRPQTEQEDNYSKLGYNGVHTGKKKKVAIREVSLYPKYTTDGIMNTCTCMYGCRSMCMSYMRVHMYMCMYLYTCGCAVCWRATLACFPQAHALSLAFPARVD